MPEQLQQLDQLQMDNQLSGAEVGLLQSIDSQKTVESRQKVADDLKTKYHLDEVLTHLNLPTLSQTLQLSNDVQKQVMFDNALQQTLTSVPALQGKVQTAELKAILELYINLLSRPGVHHETIDGQISDEMQLILKSLKTQWKGPMIPDVQRVAVENQKLAIDKVVAHGELSFVLTADMKKARSDSLTQWKNTFVWHGQTVFVDGGRYLTNDPQKWAKHQAGGKAEGFDRKMTPADLQAKAAREEANARWADIFFAALRRPDGQPQREALAHMKVEDIVMRLKRVPKEARNQAYKTTLDLVLRQSRSLDKATETHVVAAKLHIIMEAYRETVRDALAEEKTSGKVGPDKQVLQQDLAHYEQVVYLISSGIGVDEKGAPAKNSDAYERFAATLSHDHQRLEELNLQVATVLQSKSYPEALAFYQQLQFAIATNYFQNHDTEHGYKELMESASNALVWRILTDPVASEQQKIQDLLAMAKCLSGHSEIPGTGKKLGDDMVDKNLAFVINDMIQTRMMVKNQQAVDAALQNPTFAAGVEKGLGILTSDRLEEAQHDPEIAIIAQLISPAQGHGAGGEGSHGEHGESEASGDRLDFGHLAHKPVATLTIAEKTYLTSLFSAKYHYKEEYNRKMNLPTGEVRSTRIDYNVPITLQTKDIIPQVKQVNEELKEKYYNLMIPLYQTTDQALAHQANSVSDLDRSRMTKNAAKMGAIAAAATVATLATGGAGALAGAAGGLTGMATKDILYGHGYDPDNMHDVSKFMALYGASILSGAAVGRLTSIESVHSVIHQTEHGVKHGLRNLVSERVAHHSASGIVGTAESFIAGKLIKDPFKGAALQYLTP